MSDGLPEEIWSYLFRPAPVWPWSIEPGWDPDQPPTRLAERDVPGAFRSAFAFLGEFGFVLAAPDAWDLADDAVTLAWERSDALLFATLALDGSFFVLIAPRPPGDEDNTSTRARLIALLDQRDRVAEFGSLPVLASDPAGVASSVAVHVGAFEDRLGRHLANRPIDPVRLAGETAAAVEDIQRTRLVEHFRTQAEIAWASERWPAYLRAMDELDARGEPLDVGDRERMAIATGRRLPPPTLGEDAVDERERMRRAIALINDKKERLEQAIPQRHRNAHAWARWEDAALDWQAALTLLYPPDYHRKLESLRVGESDGIEMGIAFLEVDPWSFRTGYAKETILRYLKRVDLTADQADRLRTVIVHAIDVGDRREFRGYCRLARRIIDQRFRATVLSRLHSPDTGIARRALWVLDALGEPLGSDDVPSARSVLEEAAHDRQWWRVSRWVASDVRRYADKEWIDRLLEKATARGRDQDAALRLLTTVRIDPSDSQRRILGQLVLDAARSDGDSDWIEGMAVAADHPELRSGLIAAYLAASNDDERRQTWWAINAIRHASNDGWPGDVLNR